MAGRSRASGIVESRPGDQGRYQDDVPSWLELIPEAERLFGPTPTFDTHLLRAIDRGTAWWLPIKPRSLEGCC